MPSRRPERDRDDRPVRRSRNRDSARAAEAAEQQDDGELDERDVRLDGRERDVGSADGGRGGHRARRRTVTAALAAQAGLRQLVELTGKEASCVTSLEPAEDGWIVGVEVIEDRRIPSSTDVLGLYEVELDEDAGLLAYRRIRRYSRGRGDEEAR